MRSASFQIRPVKWSATAVALGASALAAGCGGGGGDAPSLYAGGPGCSDKRGPGEVSADTPWCTLSRAARAAPPGRTVRVRSGRYPALEVAGRKNSKPVVFEPDPGARPSVRGLNLDSSSGFTFRGLRLTDASRFENVADVRVERSELSPSGVVVGGGRRLAFTGNRFHDLTIELDPGTRRCVAPRCGFGLRLAQVSDIEIAGNAFSAIPADGIQLAAAEDVAIERNRFADIRAFIDPSEHSDAIQILANTARVAVRRNRFERVRGIIAQPLASGNFNGYSKELVIERNRFADLHDWAMTLLDTPGVRIEGNHAPGPRGTVRLFDSGGYPAPMTGVVLVGNVLGGLQAKPGMFAERAGNRIGAGLGRRPARSR
jgi:hypothetical protein